MNQSSKILTCALFLSLLASCSQQGPQNREKVSVDTSTVVPQTDQSTNLSATQASTDVSSVASTLADAQGKVLKIDPKCVGCGHCIRFASSNFKMNFQTHKAEVISQDNLESNGIQQAINRCPVDAISVG